MVDFAQCENKKIHWLVEKMFPIRSAVSHAVPFVYVCVWDFLLVVRINRMFLYIKIQPNASTE